MKFLFVFLGGGIGSVLRYAISKYLNAFESGIPFGTLFVNILGSFFIGIFLGLNIKNQFFNQNQTLLLAVGFCGGFTTFSTFAFENVTLLKNADYFNLAFYLIASIVLSVLAIFLGLFIVK